MCTTLVVFVCSTLVLFVCSALVLFVCQCVRSTLLAIPVSHNSVSVYILLL